LIMCGVNQGQNLADDVSYSGTVAGAIEGALLGIPSIAMSLVVGSTELDQGGGKPKWEISDATWSFLGPKANAGRLAERCSAQPQFS